MEGFIHRLHQNVPQKARAAGLVPGYPDPPAPTAPAIALPEDEHDVITALQRGRDTSNMTARELLQDDIDMLRTNINAPESALQKLIDMNNALYDLGE